MRFYSKKYNEVSFNLVENLPTLLLLLIGIVYCFFIVPDLKYADEKEYYSLATNIAKKGIFSLDGTTLTASRPPSYPFFMAIFMKIGIYNIAFFKFINFIFLIGIYFLMGCLYKKYYSKFSKFLFGIFLFCYPVIIYTAGTLYPQIFSTFLMILFFYLISDFNKKISLSNAILLGSIMGILILAVPTLSAIFVVMLLFIMFNNYKNKFTTIYLIIFFFLITISPWMYRNYTVFNTFIPISTNFGINLLLGNSENTTPNSGININMDKYTMYTKDLNEVEKDQYFRKQAIQNVKNNLPRYLKLYFQKCLNYFHFRNELATQSENSFTKDLVMFFTYYPFLILSIIRLVLYKKYPLDKLEIFLYSLYFIAPVYQAIFFTRIRFRVPFDVLLLLIDTIFLSRILSLKYKSRVFNQIKS